MKVLLVGSGGREHALAWALAKSPLLSRLYCAPGNAGIAQVAECVPIAATDFTSLTKFAVDARIDFAVIAADAQLVGGLWDILEAAGIRALGPSKAAAVLEGSKGFVKDLCIEAGIPTAAYQRFREPSAAKTFAGTLGHPVVIKAAAGGGGRGIRVAETPEDLHQLMPLASAEAAAAFGDGGLYVERFVSRARHVEVQILGDGFDAIHLYERECSIQRRRQKVWEEAPAEYLDQATREALCTSAVRLARAVGCHLPRCLPGNPWRSQSLAAGSGCGGSSARLLSA